jgi:hypothetical protein
MIHINLLLLLSSLEEEEIEVLSTKNRSTTSKSEKEIIKLPSLHRQSLLTGRILNTFSLESFFGGFPGMPHVAWYPNGNDDFKSLIHLTPEYYRINNLKDQKIIYPDLFVISNPVNHVRKTFGINEVLYQNDSLIITVTKKEKLSQLFIGKKTSTEKAEKITSDKIMLAEFLIIQIRTKNEKNEYFDYYINLLYLLGDNIDIYDLIFKRAKLWCSHLLLKNVDQSEALFNDNNLMKTIDNLNSRVVFSNKVYGNDVLQNNFHFSNQIKDDMWMSRSVLEFKKRERKKEERIKYKKIVIEVTEKSWPNYENAFIFNYSK